MDKFTYLGAITAANRDCGADIKARIGLAKSIGVASGYKWRLS